MNAAVAAKRAVAQFIKLCRALLARAPDRPHAALVQVVDRIFNAGPDAPWMAARRRFDLRVQSGGAVDPPALLRLIAFRRRIPASVETFELLGRPDLRLANVESVMTRVVYWTGHRWALRHSAGLELWEHLCRRTSNVVEIGANVGYYTVPGALAAKGTYTAYEPHPRSSEALRANLRLNGVDRVVVVEAAAVPGPDPSAVELICTTGTDRAAPTGAMLKDSSFEATDAIRHRETIVVDGLPVGAVVEGGDLVKIDVEGLEAKLLLSAWPSLVAAKPVLMVEIHDFNDELRSLIVRLMHDLGARAYAMRSDRLVPVAAELLESGSLFAACQTWDFLIVPTERSSLVDGLVAP